MGVWPAGKEVGEGEDQSRPSTVAEAASDGSLLLPYMLNPFERVTIDGSRDSFFSC